MDLYEDEGKKFYREVGLRGRIYISDPEEFQKRGTAD
jgi:hypothetical protein